MDRERRERNPQNSQRENSAKRLTWHAHHAACERPDSHGGKEGLAGIPVALVTLRHTAQVGSVHPSHTFHRARPQERAEPAQHRQRLRSVHALRANCAPTACQLRASCACQLRAVVCGGAGGGPARKGTRRVSRCMPTYSAPVWRAFAVHAFACHDLLSETAHFTACEGGSHGVHPLQSNPREPGHVTLAMAHMTMAMTLAMAHMSMAMTLARSSRAVLARMMSPSPRLAEGVSQTRSRRAALVAAGASVARARERGGAGSASARLTRGSLSSLGTREGRASAPPLEQSCRRASTHKIA